jgi:hypothetical protein
MLPTNPLTRAVALADRLVNARTIPLIGKDVEGCTIKLALIAVVVLVADLHTTDLESFLRFVTRVEELAVLEAVSVALSTRLVYIILRLATISPKY